MMRSDAPRMIGSSCCPPKLGPGRKKVRKKGAGPICRNGPEGAAHQWLLTLFSGPTRWLLASLSAVLVAGLSVRPAGGAERQPAAEKPIREIYVPFGDLPLLLEGDVERVFLTREQYEGLLQRARRVPRERAPRKALLLSADYEGSVQEGRAELAGTLRIEALEPGWHAIPLDLSGVGILRATLDGQPAPLGREPSGRPILFVEGPKAHELRLQLVAPVATSAAEQTLQFEVPVPAAARLQLTAPGDVDVRSGAAVVRRAVENAGGTTRLELLAQRGPIALVLSLNNRLLLQERSVVARSVLVDEVTQAYERIHATVSLAVLHGAMDRCRFALPRGFEVTDVGSPALSRWAVERGEGESRPVLACTLREPATETVVVNLSAVNNRGPAEAWSFPRIEPLEVVGQVAVVGVLAEDRLSVDSIAASGLIPVPNQALRDALPESVFRAEPGAPPVRPVVAYYAPQGAYHLAARFTRPPARLDVISRLVLTLHSRRQVLRAGFTLAPQVEKLFAVDLSVPQGWAVVEVTADKEQKLSFDQFPGSGAQRPRIRVRLPQGVAPGQYGNLSLQAASTPPGWLDPWSSTTVAFPLVAVLGATNGRGALAVCAPEDLSVRPEGEAIRQLRPLDAREKAQFGLQDTPATLVYGYEAPPHDVTIAVDRVPPWITCRAFSFLRLDPGLLTAHYELLYDIQRAPARRLSFRLPKNTLASLSIRGLDGVAVEEFTSEIADQQRRWTALLADERQGPVRLAVDFQQRVERETLKDWPLPLVRADEVAYQSAIASVEGNPEQDVTVNTEARKVDVGEAAEAEYQPGRRLLGVFSFAGPGEDVRVDVAPRAGYGLPTAIVQKAELVTQVSTSGRSQTAARLLLLTREAYLEITLPPHAELWSAVVDGKPSTPQLEGGRLLLSLPSIGDKRTCDVQMVYQSPVAPLAGIGMGDIAAEAPQLVLRGEGGHKRIAVPVADLEWHLVLPPGHRVVRASGGTVFLDLPARRPSPLGVIAAALYQLAGGIRPWYRASMPDGSAEQVAGQRRGRAMSSAAASATGPPAAPPPTSAPARAAQVAAEPALDLAQKPKDRGEARAPEAELGDSLRTSGRENVRAGEATDRAQRAEEGVSLGLEANAAADKYWALEGVRSLKIDLDQTGQQVTFRSMGVEPWLRATLASERSLGCLAWSLVLLVGLVGLCLTNQPARRKAGFLVEAMVLALLFPLLVGWVTDLDLRCVFEPAFYAAWLLVPYYVFFGAAKWICRQLRALPLTRRAARAAAAGGLILLAGAAAAGEAPRAPIAADLLDLLQPGAPIRLPQYAVVLPYDADDPQGVQKAAKVLIPYQEYAALWSEAFPGKPLDGAERPPAYALAGAQYRSALRGDEFLHLSGTFDMEVYADEGAHIPLPLAGGVLAGTTLDGQPARVHVLEAARSPGAAGAGVRPPASQTGTAPAPAPRAAGAPPGASVVLLHVPTKGRKRLELAVRLRIERSGGWRIVRAQLPAAPATQLALVVPKAQTELRLAGVPDRDAYETKSDNETLATALGAKGQLNLQWRPKVAAGQVDQSLSANSTAVLDIQEDGLRLVWRLDLEFPRSQRDSFTIAIPAGYLLERVRGPNVRGWKVAGQEGRQRVDVRLLKATAGKESLTLQLTRFGPVGQGEFAPFELPVVAVPEAVLHQGCMAIRRSPLLNVRAEGMQGLSRVDLPEEALRPLQAELAQESPLGIRPFESYRFAATPYQLTLAAAPYRPQVSAEIQSLLRIGERESGYEARVRCRVQDRPIQQVRLSLPADFRLEDVAFPGPCEWAETGAPGRRELAIYAASGHQGSFSLVLRGTFPFGAGSGAVTVPRLELLDADRQEGQLVVQADPAYDVRLEKLEHCESVLLQSVFGWLEESQREMARAAIAYRRPDYAAAIRLEARSPSVHVFTITNVRITPREIERSIYLEYAIREAGIREVSFLLPVSLREARVIAPLLREKRIQSVDGRPGLVRMRLEFQDDVMGQLVVMVEHDGELAAGSQAVPIPEIDSPGHQVDARYLVLENAGRDEVVEQAIEGLERLDRRQSQWRRLSEILGENITSAFLVREESRQPQLLFQTKRRAPLETAGARIGLARTILAVDGHGAFRGLQEYRVDNKTEPYLEIELPAGCELWTVQVANEPVKPSRAGTPLRVRIPLLKSEEGGLDYAVTLKYGGHLRPQPGTLRPLPFPLPRPANINVELSQVRLYLPETHRWFAFGGTMRQVHDALELEAGFLSYQTQQIRRLAQMLGDQVGDFRRARAANTLKQLALATHNYHRLYGALEERGTSHRLLQQELSANAAALREADRKQQGFLEHLQTTREPSSDNRDLLARRYVVQEPKRSKNVVTQMGANWRDVVPESSGQGTGPRFEFNSNWLKHAQLETKPPVQAAQELSRVAGHPAKSPAAGVPPIPAPAMASQVAESKEPRADVGRLPPLNERVPEQRARGELSRKREESARQQLERYQRRLEQDTAQQLRLDPMQAVQAQGPQARGLGGSGPERAAVPGGSSMPSPADMRAMPGGMPGDWRAGDRADGAARRWATFGAAIPSVAASPDGRLPGAAGSGGPAAQGVMPSQLPATGLASLDIELPTRGIEYLFTTPRGEVEITARSVSAAHVERLLELAGIVALLAAVALCARTLGYLRRVLPSWSAR